MSKYTRRNFFSKSLKLAAMGIASTSVFRTLFSNIAKAEEAPAKKDLSKIPWIDPKAPLAVAVKYVEDFKKSKEAKGNQCTSCALYELANQGQKDKKTAAPCQLFMGNIAPAVAYCSSWNKRQA